ncbi:MAG TPA: orotidine-5'-phosphate decarboxylase [Pyrinomonadaceae bacterium]|jgi:orotidine-5'-phosphate decarboxylase
MRDARERIIVPLDVSTEKEAVELILSLREHVGIFKIGLELLNSVGVNVVRNVVELGGSVFFDGKFMDIPNTVAGASRAVARLGVRMFNVHAMGGVEMMRSSAESSREEARRLGVTPPIVLGVTVLTSIDQAILRDELRVPGSVEDHVVHLARMVADAGLDGVIASPHEVEAIAKRVSENLLVITPGVRPAWAAATQDQKRVMTPGEAILNGASHVVIGRPITKPPAEIGSPVEATKLVVEEINAALRRREANNAD